MAIRDRLTDGSVALTRSDLKVARALLGDYPAAGLGTVAQLAARSAVSGPTVVRFVTRLGFEGFAEFQKALVAEVQARMNSPLAMIDAGKTEAVPREQIAREVMRAASRMIASAAELMPEAEIEAAARLMADPTLRLHLLGGRFSGYLAGMLWAHLRHLRPEVHRIEASRSDAVDSLIDLGKRDVVIAFDYRRYQLDTITLVTKAAARGAKVVLFTDPWASPLAACAKVVLTAPVEGPSPFDSLVPALAQVEAVIAAVTLRLTPASRGRIAEIEALRRASGITEHPPATGESKT